MLTYYQSRVALGSMADLALVSDSDESTINELFRQLWLALLTFERRCSRFLPGSELSQFNRSAGTSQPITLEFRDVLLAAREMAAHTEGLYNPFILPALQRAGYVHSMVSTHTADPVDDFSDRSIPTADRLEIGDTWARIPYGSAIDLGGCGKGYAGDMLAAMAESLQVIQGFWFSLGGDVVMGGLNEEGTPWIIDIEDLREGNTGMAGRAHAPDTTRYAVATSSITQRKGIHNGKAWHHIIDPRTNQPAVATTATASISARSALLADVLASCAIILDAEGALDFLREKGAEGVLLQGVDGSLKHWGGIRAKNTRKSRQ
jgi:thiamine biosynthesis lipoprotein